MIENVQVKKAYDGTPVKEPRKPKKDDPKAEERLRKCEAWFANERQAQSGNRWKMARAQDFVDGIQWTAEEKAELEERNQPAMVFNLVGTTVRWITGTEKRTRVDYQVVGRGKEDTESAENKTALLKYLNDVNKAYHRSKAFEDAVTAGVGWLEIGVRGDQGEEPLYERYVSWRNIWHDRLATEPDCSDGRYIFKAKWVDLDNAIVYFPEFKKELENAAEEHDSYYVDDEFDAGSEEYESQVVLGDYSDVHHSKRKRVRLVECWYKETERCNVIRSKCAANRAIFNESDKRLVSIANLNEVYPAIRQRMRIAIFISGRENKVGKLLYDGNSPYWHNRFPLVPVWGYKRKRDNLPYSPVDGLIDPQVDLNKRRSKALFILSTNQVVMDKGAVDDVNTLAEEVSNPNGIIEKNPGKELDIRNDKSLAQQHINLMDQDAQYIQKVGGVTDENLGRQTNATSGKAIEARQDQGTTVTADLFDNLRLAIQIAGELKLSLIEQYYDEEKTIRILGDRGKVEFKQIDGSITETQADFVVDEQAFNQSARAAMFEQLFTLVSKLDPQVALSLLDVVVDMSDVPMRDELVARIRQINGQRDADEEPTPEEIAKLEEQKAAEDQAKQLQERAVVADISVKEGKAAESAAKVKKMSNEAINDKLDAIMAALEVAGVLRNDPTLGQNADAVIEDATI